MTGVELAVALVVIVIILAVCAFAVDDPPPTKRQWRNTYMENWELNAELDIRMELQRQVPEGEWPLWEVSFQSRRDAMQLDVTLRRGGVHLTWFFLPELMAENLTTKYTELRLRYMLDKFKEFRG